MASTYIGLPTVNSAIQAQLDEKLKKGSQTVFVIDNGDFATGQAAVDAASPG